MKFRKGFVSNSSSSSFVCVGVSDKEMILKLDEADIRDGDSVSVMDFGFGVYQGKHLTHLGSFGDESSWIVGLEIESLLEEGKTLSECKKMFQDIAKNDLGIDVPMSLIIFEYGETSSE